MRTAFTFYFVTVLFANTLTAMWISIHIPYLSAFSIRQCFFFSNWFNSNLPALSQVGAVYWNPLHTEKAFQNLYCGWALSHRWVEDPVTTFLCMIRHGLFGIVTQATRAASIVLSGVVFGARLPLDNEQSMSFAQYLHIVEKRPSLSHLREPWFPLFGPLGR